MDPYANMGPYLSPQNARALEIGVAIGAAEQQFEKAYCRYPGALERLAIEHKVRSSFDKKERVPSITDMAIAKFGGIYGRAPNATEMAALVVHGLDAAILKSPIEPSIVNTPAHQPSQESTKMTRLSLVSLVALASATNPATDDDFEFTGDLAKEFEEAQAELVAETKKASIATIKVLLVEGKNAEARVLSRLREARRLVKAAQNSLNQLNRAKRYASVTSNFIPWAKAIGYTHYDCGVSAEEFEKHSVIPDGWSAPEDVPEPTIS